MLLRETRRTIRQTPATWVMSAVTLAVALALSGLLCVLAWKAHAALESIRRDLTIEAFFDPSVSSEDASAIVERDLRGIRGIQSLDFTTKEQAIEEYERSSGENVQTILGLNPLPASVTVHLTDPSKEAAERVISSIKGVSGIVDVTSDLEMHATMEQRSASLQRLALLVGGMLALLAIIYIISSARHTLHRRADVLRTINLLGGSRRMVIGPIILESGFAGALGGALGAVFLLVLLRSASSLISADLHVGVSTPHMIALFAAFVLGGLVLAAGLGWLGTLVRERG